jgi:hypothetical protein
LETTKGISEATDRQLGSISDRPIFSGFLGLRILGNRCPWRRNFGAQRRNDGKSWKKNEEPIMLNWQRGFYNLLF